MPHKKGESRDQMFMFSLESAIAPDSFVRVVDAFVDAIDLKSFGFAYVECQEEGRPSYPPSALLKLYLYGYHFGIRTSRKLEREAKTNLETMWLLHGLRPRYKTIADFRRIHSKAFREVFRRFVCLLREWDLIEGETVAIDSFKIRGSNSLKNNFNESKLRRHLEYIDGQIKEYEAQLDANDNEDERIELEKKIAKRNEKKARYQKIKQDLHESGQEQISLTDPDSRSVILHKNIINVGYNIQASSDSKHKLLVEYATGTVNDTHDLSEMALATKELLGVEQLNVLADKGYHTGEELARCTENGITTYVSPKAPATKDTGLFPISTFRYELEKDQYVCPAGETMTTNGTWHQHSDGRNNRSAYRFRRFTTASCKGCTLRNQCTKGRNGRYIDRSEYADIIEENAHRVKANPDYYRKRQQITEHMFGTLKRQRGFTHALVRKKDPVLGEVGLMFTGYNLSRCVRIFGFKELIKLLKDSCLRDFLCIKRLVSRHFNSFLIRVEKITPENISPKICPYLSTRAFIW